MSNSENSENYDNMDPEGYDLVLGAMYKWQGSSKRTMNNSFKRSSILSFTEASQSPLHK